MKLIGRFILFTFAACILAVVYWYSPVLMHSQSRLYNFLQLVGASLVLGIALIIFTASTAMSFDKRSPLASKMPAPPKARSVPEELAGEFNYVRQQLTYASECKSMYGVELKPDGRIESLARAVSKLAAIMEFISSK